MPNLSYIALPLAETDIAKIVIGAVFVIVWLVAQVASSIAQQKKKQEEQRRRLELTQPPMQIPSAQQPQPPVTYPRRPEQQPQFRQQAPPAPRQARSQRDPGQQRPQPEAHRRQPRPTSTRTPPAQPRKPAPAVATAKRAPARLPEVAAVAGVSAREIGSASESSSSAANREATMRRVRQLMTRRGVRDVFIATEILGPPLALRRNA